MDYDDCRVGQPVRINDRGHRFHGLEAEIVNIDAYRSNGGVMLRIPSKAVEEYAIYARYVEVISREMEQES